MQFASVLGTDEMLIDSFEGVEGISRLFEFQVELFADAGSEIDPSKVIGTKATIAISLLDTLDVRYINGLIAAFEQTSGDDAFDVYRAHIVPSLWLLTLGSNCRVFQNKMPMEIIKEVINPYSLSVSDVTEGSYQPLDYCTQYGESDFNFISRIAEQFGIFYWFEHENGNHKVVFGDSRDAYSPCPQASTLPYSPQQAGQEEMYQSRVSDIRATAAMVTGKFNARDYDYRTFNFNAADALSSGHPMGKNAFERYVYPTGDSGYVKIVDKVVTKPNHGATMMTAQRDASDVGANTFHGVSSMRTFLPGFTFDLTKHPRSAWNQTYLLIEVAHHVIQVPPYAGDASSRQTPYTNRFTAIESDRQFRPVAKTVKPRIPGPQTAFVVTPSGEEIFLDKLGRVSVQFYWDRERAANTVDNMWVRVAQPWAGNGWGTYFWPRKGDEVVVNFIDGDPDKPVVVGSVYNAVNVPKYALPDNSTRTGILTRSSKGGTAANANELRFEDKEGSEEIYINAEKDMNTNVENANSRTVGADETISVQGNRKITVQKNQSIGVTGNQSIAVQGNQTESIKGNNVMGISGTSDATVTGKHRQLYSADAHITYGGDLNEKVAANYSLQTGSNVSQKTGSVFVIESGQEVHVKGGMTVTVEAGMEICLKGAGGFISIGPSGVTIQGTMVLINSGGAAGSGSPGTYVEPEQPTAPPAPSDSGSGDSDS